MIKLSFRDVIKSALNTYHGTDGRFLAKILSEGILAQSPQARFDKGVYLTSEIEKAARYAVDGIEKTNGIPVILQISISSEKKIKKIYRDTLDRDESHLYENDDNYDEDIQSLERDIDEVIQAIAPGTRLYGQDKSKFGLDFDSYGDKSSLRGINIYRNILGFARQKGLDLNKVKQVMFSMIPPGTHFGNINVAEDGSLTIDMSETENMHQQVYPKKLPPSVIKAVWISNVPKNIEGERMSIASKLLPQESRAIFDGIRNLYNKYGFEKEMNADDVEDLINDLSDLNHGGWFDDDIQKIQTNHSSIPDVLMSLEEFANEEAFDGLSGKGTEFTKMIPQMALQYINSLMAVK